MVDKHVVNSVTICVAIHQTEYFYCGYMWTRSDLADEQVAAHLAGRNVCGLAEGIPVKRRREHVREPKRQHGRDPS